LSSPHTNSGNSYSGRGAQWATAEEQRQIWRFLNNLNSPDGSVTITKGSGGISFQVGAAKPISVSYDAATSKFTISAKLTAYVWSGSESVSPQSYPMRGQRISVVASYSFVVDSSSTAWISFYALKNVSPSNWERGLFYYTLFCPAGTATPDTDTAPFEHSLSAGLAYSYQPFGVVLNGADGTYTITQCPSAIFFPYIDRTVPTVYLVGPGRISLSFGFGSYTDYLDVTKDGTARTVYLGPTGQMTYTSAGAIATLGQIQVEANGKIIRLPQAPFLMTATDKNDKTIKFPNGSNILVY